MYSDQHIWQHIHLPSPSSSCKMSFSCSQQSMQMAQWRFTFYLCSLFPTQKLPPLQCPHCLEASPVYCVRRTRWPGVPVSLLLFSCYIVSSSFVTLRPVAQPGSSVHGTLQARILEWIVTSFSRGTFPTQRWNPHPLHCRQILYHWFTREAHSLLMVPKYRWKCGTVKVIRLPELLLQRKLCVVRRNILLNCSDGWVNEW